MLDCPRIAHAAASDILQYILLGEGNHHTKAVSLHLHFIKGFTAMLFATEWEAPLQIYASAHATHLAYNKQIHTCTKEFCCGWSNSAATYTHTQETGLHGSTNHMVLLIAALLYCCSLHIDDDKSGFSIAMPETKAVQCRQHIR
jgi:hypothetical protein